MNEMEKSRKINIDNSYKIHVREKCSVCSKYTCDEVATGCKTGLRSDVCRNYYTKCLLISEN